MSNGQTPCHSGRPHLRRRLHAAGGGHPGERLLMDARVDLGIQRTLLAPFLAADDEREDTDNGKTKENAASRDSVVDYVGMRLGELRRGGGRVDVR